MGCDMTCYVENNTSGGWKDTDISVFDWRSYGLYGWLADVRNYSAVPPIVPPRGFPSDASSQAAEDHDDINAHSASWVLVSELLSFDYGQSFNDRRVTRQVGPMAFDGGCTGEPHEGTMITYREFFGECFFKELEKLKQFPEGRLVFWFSG